MKANGGGVGAESGIDHVPRLPREMEGASGWAGPLLPGRNVAEASTCTWNRPQAKDSDACADDGALRERHVKRAKGTTSSTTAASMHGMRRRDDPPSEIDERGGQGLAIRGGGEIAATDARHAIRGREQPPGGQRVGYETGIGDDATFNRLAVTRETSISDGASSAKRRRTEERGDGCGLNGGPEPRADSSTQVPWSSRRALLASLRAGVRPPERPT